MMFESTEMQQEIQNVKNLIYSNNLEQEIKQLYGFRNKVDSINTYRHHLLTDYWKRKRLQAIADTSEISSTDSLFFDTLEAALYQDTMNIDSILLEINPYNDTLLYAIDETIKNYKQHEYLKWIRSIRNDTINLYLVNIEGDSMLVRLYKDSPSLLRFSITDYWGAKIPAVIRDVEKRSFRILIDDAPELYYQTEEKAKRAIGGMRRIAKNRQLTVKPIPFTVFKPLWMLGGNTNLDISQVGMYQWAKGGDPSVAILGGLELFANYKQNNISWDNEAVFKYGLIRQGRYADTSVHIRSSEDRVEFSSKFGYKAFGQFYVSLEGDFKSQFGPRYTWDGNEKTNEKLSDFMSPGYLTFSLGLDYKPKDNTTLFFSPLTSKTTYVLDDSVSIKTRYGVDSTSNARYEIGIGLKASHKLTVWDDIVINNSLELFSSYVDNPQNVDVNWEVSIVFPVNDYIRATLSTNFIYDDDTSVPKYRLDDDGVEESYDGKGAQFKEMITLGFALKF
jgi:hypothetical protein